MDDHALLGDFALDAVRELLPAWVLWGNTLVALALVSLLPLALGHFAILRMFKAIPTDPGVHWSERARAFHPLRVVLVNGTLVLLIYTAMLAAALPNRVAPLSRTALVLLLLIACDAAAIVRGRSLTRRLGRPLVPWLVVLRENLCATLLFSSIYWTLLLALALPEQLSGAPFAGAVAGVLVLVFFCVGGGVLVLEAFGLATRLPVPRTEHAARNETILRVSLPYANAFAFPFVRRIVVTERAASALTQAELAAVLDHEREHLEETWILLVSRLTPLALLLVLALWRPLVAQLGAPAWVSVLMILLLVHSATRSWRRRAEEQADAAALRHTENPEIYARALERLHEVELRPAILREKGSHPQLYDRMLAAGAQPDFARPAAPARASAWIVGPYVLCGIGLIAAGIALAKEDGVDREDRSQLHFALAFRGDTASWLEDLGLLEDSEGESERAVIFLRASSTLDTDSPYLPAELSASLSACGECAQARAALQEAERRSRSWPHESALDDDLSDARELLEECEQSLPAEDELPPADQKR